MSRLPQYPAQPTRSIVDAVDVLAETGPTLGRPLGTDVRILFTFAPDRTLILLYAGDKAGEWNDWYRRAVPAAADLYLDYLTATGQR